jgi:hypothetical protein
MDAIKPGTLVLYTHSPAQQGAGIWSGVVTEVDHSKRHEPCARITFDGIVVPEACAAGIKGVQPQSNWLEVDFDKLTVRQPGPDDDAKRIVWAAKVSAYDSLKKAQAAVAHAATMESYSHFRVGQRVSWPHLVAMGWGPEPDSYRTYIGTIDSIALPELKAVVTGAPLVGTGATMTHTTGLAALTLECSCDIDCESGMLCGSPQWLALKQQKAVEEKERRAKYSPANFEYRGPTLGLTNRELAAALERSLAAIAAATTGPK